MTRRGFILIADAIRHNIQDKAQREVIAAALIPALRADNPRFDSARFKAAAVGE